MYCVLPLPLSHASMTCVDDVASDADVAQQPVPAPRPLSLVLVVAAQVVFESKL